MTELLERGTHRNSAELPPSVPAGDEVLPELIEVIGILKKYPSFEYSIRRGIRIVR
jgi:hypothetical protein